MQSPNALFTARGRENISLDIPFYRISCGCTPRRFASRRRRSTPKPLVVRGGAGCNRPTPCSLQGGGKIFLLTSLFIGSAVVALRGALPRAEGGQHQNLSW